MKRALTATGAVVWTFIGWRYVADICRYRIAKHSYQTKGT